MKSLLILFALVGSCFGQQPDKGFLGVWNLDVAKSKHPPGTAPKGQQIIISENGAVTAVQNPSGGAPSLGAVATIRGECYAIGALPATCTFEVKNPRLTVLTIKLGDMVVQKDESELVSETTMRVTDTKLSPTGPVVSEEFFTKALPPSPPAPPKK